MKVIVVEPTGMCAGVRRAIVQAEKVAREHGFSLGPVVHNPGVVQRLEQAGLRQISLSEIEKGATLLIRSHGAAPNVYQAAIEKGVKIIDATCPHVLRLQKETRHAIAAGMDVVIVGDRHHPEIEAVLAHAGGIPFVVQTPADLDVIPIKAEVAVLAQTTTSPILWQTVVECLQAQGRKVKPIETICRATQERQQATYELAREADIMVVVGGNNSANTRNLADICRSVGTPTYQVEGALELQSDWFIGIELVGVAAGASTPEWNIKEVVVAMENMENKALGEQETVVGEDPQQETITVPNLKRGQVVEGKVVSVDAEGVGVDIGHKSEAYIAKNELSNDPERSPLDVCQVGETVVAVVLRIDSKEDKVLLSRRRALEEQGMKDLATARDTGRILQGKILEAVKGGVMVEVLGVKTFMPASHVDLRYVPDLASYVGQTISIVVKEIEEARRRVVVSRKEALEKKTEEIKSKTWDSLVVGSLRDGTVQRLTDFGAFVDLGGIDGLVHVSEIAWQRVNHPSEALTEGQAVRVKVLGVDREKGRVSLSIKQGEGDPWNKLTEKFTPGSVVPGKIVRTASFGAFVEIAPGIEGLVHISQLSHERVERTEDAVKPGDEVTVKILSIVPAEHRVSLSIKEAVDRPRTERTERPDKGERRDRGEKRGRDDRNQSYREESKVTLGDKFGDLLKDQKS
ncbi:MAG: bifunctional 4-hydroxy-3-methylbut-2-enyl diphosphate reductase/30S ribosomal protein S1 [Peptococcaceae bacterium]|nr:bifunctional 4-hydroxy-3-methylbut-2-enyl diphosphate reductase/30S ribosomal protein S1 [Peptococcaceae bacterium]